MRSLPGCPDDNQITLLVDGQLDAHGAAAVQAHLVDCVACRKVVDVLHTARPHFSTGSGGLDELGANVALLGPGDRVGRYEVEDLLGAGGMGVVYAARDPELDRRVALKLLYPTLGASDTLIDRLRAESKAMARLNHPNVATIHDIGSHGGRLFLVIELVEGPTLRTWIGGDHAWERVVQTLVEAGKGLAAAHDAGIIHCDFKPDNVLLGADGRPRVTDFGLSQVVGVSTSAERDPSRVLGDVTSSSVITTATGVVFGTPAYMAPERFDAIAPVDVAGDLFAFCIALYEVLHGRRPFAGETIAELRASTRAGVSRSGAGDAKVPGWLDDVLARGLDPEPSARFQTMQELLTALTPRRRRRRAWLWVPIAGVAVAGLAVAGWSLLRGDEPAASCDARGELAGIWDEPTRARVATALAGDALAAGRVARALDRYTAGWLRASEAACATPAVAPDVADATRRCLRSVRIELRAVTEQLVAGGPIVKTAERTIAGLPSIDDCGAKPAPPRPADDATRAQVDRLRDELAAAQGLDVAAKFDAAARAIDAVATKATALGYRPLVAEVQYARALNLRGASTTPEATAQALREAAALAQASGHDVLAVQAWLALAHHAAQATGDFARGREYASYASAALERLGNEPRFAAKLAATRGAIEWRDGKLDAAREYYQRALALTADDPAAHREAENGLGIVDTAAGRYREALAEHLEVLASRRQEFGDDHPEIARSYTTLGEVTMRMGRSAESLDYYQKADAVSQRAFGPDHPTVQITAHNLGGILRDLARPGDAERELRRAVKIATAAFGPDHPYVAKSQQSLGMALADQGKFAEAVTELEHSLAIRRKAYGETHIETLGAMSDLGIALRGAGRLDEALAYAAKAVAGSIAQRGPDSDDVAEALVEQARTLIAAHRPADARASLAKARAIYAHGEAPAERLAGVDDLLRQLDAKPLH